MATDENRDIDIVLKRIDATVEQWLAVDSDLLHTMAYAIECGATHDEVARRVTVYSQPTMQAAFALIARQNRIDRLLSDAGIGVLTHDDTDEVWVRIVNEPRLGITIRHDEENLDLAGDPGTIERRTVAEQVAAAVVTCLYDAGFELVAGTTRLARDQAQDAFADPDACLWIEESPRLSPVQTTS